MALIKDQQNHAPIIYSFLVISWIYLRETSDQAPHMTSSRDVSPGNDGTSKLEYDGGFGGPLRKEWIDEAVEILRRADRLCPPPS
jgi:hypothetical protein